MDPLSGQNRGYAFITYCNKDDAQKAVKLVSGWGRVLEKNYMFSIELWKFERITHNLSFQISTVLFNFTNT